jgi:DNA (cytosine-5)-methyltransferase 1
MIKPLLYDICCCAGGCTKGYQNAGFRVIGVDNIPQPHYIGDGFILMDCLEFLDRYIQGEFERADAFHASPPCQDSSRAAIQWRKAGKVYPKLIEPVRDRLIAIGKPYILENVPGAPLINPTILNGAMFGARVRRRRLFETSFEMPLVLIPKEEAAHFPKMGRAVREGEIITPVGHFSNIPYARRQMGIDWMNQGELAQAILPVYTQFMGGFLMAEVLK